MKKTLANKIIISIYLISIISNSIIYFNHQNKNPRVLSFEKTEQLKSQGYWEISNITIDEKRFGLTRSTPRGL